MFASIVNVFGKHGVKILVGAGAAAATAVVLKRTGTDKKIAEVARKVGTGTVDVAAKATDTLAATGELVISGADKAVETVSYGAGAATRMVLDFGSKAGSKIEGNAISRGFAAGFYQPEAQAVEGVLAQDFAVPARS